MPRAHDGSRKCHPHESKPLHTYPVATAAKRKPAAAAKAAPDAKKPKPTVDVDVAEVAKPPMLLGATLLLLLPV